MLTPKQAGYLLSRYPLLFEQLENRREDILEGYRQGAVAGGRKSVGSYSDPTAKKVMLLMDNNNIFELISMVGDWIDNELPPESRPFLFSMWRYGRFGWELVSKDLGQGEWLCKLQWITLTTQLADYLNKRVSAGRVLGSHGIASANFHIENTPA
ncbi:MAG: hypothetical protein H0Z28_11685 [Archaeoglobus sp.]|nr:hypothetical protein [Archaeoglobus sp.]